MNIAGFLQGFKAAGLGKSKTVNINTLITGLILWYCQAHHIELEAADAVALTAAVYWGLNMVLRALTGKSLPEKGAALQRPETLMRLIEESENNPEEVERVVEALNAAVNRVKTNSMADKRSA